MNLRALLTAAATLAAGLVLFVAIRGPVRGWGGDVLIVVLLVAAAAAVGLGTPARRVGGAFALGVLAEVVQSFGLVPADAHWFWHLTIGSTADPWDGVAYAVGAAIAWRAEAAWAPAAAADRYPSGGGADVELVPARPRAGAAEAVRGEDEGGEGRRAVR